MLHFFEDPKADYNLRAKMAIQMYKYYYEGGLPNPKDLKSVPVLVI